MEEDQFAAVRLDWQPKTSAGRQRKRKGTPMKLNLKSKRSDGSGTEEPAQDSDQPLNLAVTVWTPAEPKTDKGATPSGSDDNEPKGFGNRSKCSKPKVKVGDCKEAADLANASDVAQVPSWNPAREALIASLEQLEKDARQMEEDLASGKAYLCEVCKKVYNQKRSYQAHVRYSHPNPEQSFVCTYCTFATPIRGNWLNHLAETHRMDPEGNELQPNIKCTECDFVCVTKRRLKSHAYWKHATDKKHKCIECEYSAISKCDLEKHVNIVHVGERPYECNKCGFRSKTVSALNSHMRAHTGVRRFQCELCEKSYTHGAQLKLHMYNHSKDVKPFTCHMCAYSTHRRDYLQQHVRRIHVTDRIHISESAVPS